MNKINKKILKKIYLRLLKMHHDSQVGHIGGNLSSIDAITLLFHEFLSEKDIFILSKGHAAGALYVTLWSMGFLSDTDLQKFHKDNTTLPGHPPSRGMAQVPFGTGSLGHGLSLAAGTAFAKKIKRDKSKIFCLLSDGELQEGSSWEALIFLCHHNLNNLTIIIDHNNLQGFGSTAEIASMVPLKNKFVGFNLDIQVINGHNINKIRKALNKKTTKPKLIILKTIKGHGISFMENQMKWHYLPLNDKLYEKAIKEIEAK